MLKSITSFSVRYPVSVTMIITAILLLGYISLGKLGVDLFPDLNNPRLFIEITSGERPPEEMEEMFVDRVEGLAIRQSGVVNVSSVCRVGVAQVEVEYTWEKDMDEAFLDLSKSLAMISQDDDIDELNISQDDPNARPVMLVALQHDENTDLNDLRKTAENYIRNELIRLEGIADVEVNGAADIEVVVETSEYLLESYGLTLNTLANRIESFNQNITGGSIVEEGKRYVVRGLSELEQVSDLEQVIVKMESPQANPNGEKIHVLLRDVAKVSYQFKDMENSVMLNGQPALGLSIYKEMRYNTVKAVDDLRIALADIQRALPGYKFTIAEDQGRFISGAITEVRDSALGGIALAIFVLLIFLRRLGPTAIVGAAIPLSIIATFTLMYFTDLTVNIMTLGGLALGAGMLVDNAIIVLENVFRHHEQGKSAAEAAVDGTTQVGGAIIASTLTTIVVFLPIVFLHGASGELFKDQALTVSFSLLCSLIIAILIIPMLYSRFYKRPFSQRVKAKGSIELAGYGKWLGNLLPRYKMVLLIALLLMVLGGWMVSRIGSEFMPKTDSREFYIDMKLPEGTQLERTSGAVSSLELMIRELAGENIELIYSEVGPASGLSSDGNSVFEDQNSATVKAILKHKSAISANQLIRTLGDFYEGNDQIEVMFRQQESALQSILGTTGAPVVIELVGDELSVLEEITDTVMILLNQVPGIYNLVSSVEGGAPEVNIQIDRYRAGLMNLDVNSIVNSVSEQLQGVNAGQMDISGEMKDITLRLEEPTLRDLENLTIETNNTKVLLKEVAEINFGYSPREILHNNQNRVIKITADLDKNLAMDKAVSRIDAALAPVSFPHNYRYQVTGEEQLRKESMGNLGFAFLLSIILVYMVLASQFESLLHPFTILLTVPLSVVGAIAVFYFQGKALNIMSFIGIIMLVGIAVNDSIILVDAINQFRQQGLRLREAIAAAGQQRIRPIIMTSLTTILALVPLTIGFGESASLRSPMAWAVIGGLVTSTFLTLVVIPCVYLWFGQIEERIKSGRMDGTTK